MRQKYGKMSYPELQACLMPNELSYVRKENIPIVTYVPNDDCESTLIHPSTISIPHKICEPRMLTLEHTYWVPCNRPTSECDVFCSSSRSSPVTSRSPTYFLYYILWIWDVIK